MHIVSRLGNVPKPVQVLATIEMSANYEATKYSNRMEGNFETVLPMQCFPLLVECSSIEELNRCIKNSGEDDVDQQLLVDKETGRIYLTAIGQVGRMRLVGSGEEDEATIDAKIVEQETSVIYFTEVEKANTIVTETTIEEQATGDTTGTTGVRDPGGNSDEELRCD